MQASVTVSCQKCGGIAHPVAGQEYHRCSFCTSLIQLVPVSVDRILPAGTALDCDCPTCASPLETGLIESRRALYCASCFGILLRHADFGTILQERAARRAGVEPAEPRPIDPAAFGRHLDCPSCRKTMEVHPYYGPGNIVVDSCAECGLMWLDHGELTRVEQASRIGSLSAAWDDSGTADTERQPRMTSPCEPEPAHRSPLQVLADLLF